MTGLDPGSVALVVSALGTLISAGAAAVVAILAGLRANKQTVMQGTLDAVHKQGGEVYEKVNGAADAAAAKLVGLEREITVLRQLVEAQRLAIQQLTMRTESLLAHIHLADPAASL